MIRRGTWMPFERVPAALTFFTGVPSSIETARRLTEAAGAALVAAETAAVARLECELPPVPAEPALQQLSVDGAMLAKFRNTGQSCIAANRLYVQAGIYARFVSAFVRATRPRT